MIAVVSIDEDSINGEDLSNVLVEDLGNVHVSLAGESRCNGDEENGAEWTCEHCGVALGDAGVTVDSDQSEWCDAEEWFDEEGETHQERHVPVPVPLSWANSAWINLDEGQDTIAVGISVGDPRGAFVMRVERMRYTDLETGEVRDELRLSVPTAEDGMPHMQLTALASPGYYRVS